MRILLMFLILIVPVLTHGEMVSEKPIFIIELHRTHTSSWGDLLVAYYDEDYRLYLKNVTEGWSVHINTTDPKRSQPQGIGLDTEGDSIYMAWRPKERKKEVYFRASHDRGKTWEEVKKINTMDQALMPLLLDAEGAAVAVVWQDEREKSHHTYMNYSGDRGKTFHEKDIKVTEGYDGGYNPSVLLNDGDVMVFSNGIKDKINHLLLKTSTDGGKTWKEEVLAEAGDKILYEIHPIKTGNRTLVFWCVGWDGIRGAYSDGKTWKMIPFEDTRGLDVGSIRVAHTQKGDIYLSFYAHKGKDKTRVYLYESHDRGATWSDKKRIDDTPYDITRSALQDIAADDEGRVVIVWQDYRNIRSNIYLRYSLDSGKTWLPQDIALEDKGRYNSAYPALEMVDGRIQVIAWRYTGDSLDEAYLYLFPVKEIGGRK